MGHSRLEIDLQCNESIDVVLQTSEHSSGISADAMICLQSLWGLGVLIETVSDGQWALENEDEEGQQQ